MQVRIEPQAAAADIQVIRDGLRKFNVSYIGPPNEQAVQIFLRSDLGDIAGALASIWTHSNIGPVRSMKNLDTRCLACWKDFRRVIDNTTLRNVSGDDGATVYRTGEVRHQRTFLVVG